MARGFETGSDNERIDELQRQLDDVLDSQINSVGGNEDISIDSSRGARNDASGDAGGVRSNEPIIHQITDVDSTGSPTGVFDKINLVSSMIIVNFSTPAVDMELRFIQGTAKDGAKIKITPKLGRTLIIKSGGNILTSDDITVLDTEFYELIKHSEAETGITGGAYKISLGGSGVAVDLLPLNNTWTGINTFTGTIFNVQTDAINLGDAITDSINFLGRAGTDLIPIVNSTHSLGISGRQWNNLWVDTLQNATTVVINSPNFAINSSQITLGDAITDTITFLGRIGSNAIIPIADATTDLGTSALAFDTLYVDIISNASAINIAALTLTINSGIINLGDATTDTINFLGRVGNLGIIPINDSVASLGTSGKRWDTLWVDTITSAATVAIASTNFAINSSQITLGDSTSDTINFLGRVGTDIDPDGDATRSMGSSALEWNQIFVRTLNATSTLAIAAPNFSVNSSQITLGDSTSDDVNILGRLNTDVDPSSDNNINFGSISLAYAFNYVKGGLAIVEGYATGFKPSGQTNVAILFTVPTAGGKTELRSSFQTGASVIIATEP